jgi:chromate reductase
MAHIQRPIKTYLIGLLAATGSAPYFAGDVKASLSVPSFFDNFDSEKQEITNPAILDELQSALAQLS